MFPADHYQIFQPDCRKLFNLTLNKRLPQKLQKIFILDGLKAFTPASSQ